MRESRHWESLALIPFSLASGELHLFERLSLSAFPVWFRLFRVWGTRYETTAQESSSEYTWQHPHGKTSNLWGKDNHPVSRVSFFDTLEYCRWLSIVSGTRYS